MLSLSWPTRPQWSAMPKLPSADMNQRAVNARSPLQQIRLPVSPPLAPFKEQRQEARRTKDAQRISYARKRHAWNITRPKYHTAEISRNINARKERAGSGNVKLKKRNEEGMPLSSADSTSPSTAPSTTKPALSSPCHHLLSPRSQLSACNRWL